MGTLGMSFKELTALFVVAVIYPSFVCGHGFMWYPWSWQDHNQVPPSQGLEGATFGYVYGNFYDEACDNKVTGAMCAGVKWTRYADYNANHTFVPNKPHRGPTISYDMIDLTRPIMSKVDGKNQFHPWAQPGMAPSFGEGCGVNGGNPNGCQGGDLDTSPFGTCCDVPPVGCGGYAHGKSAIDWYNAGVFKDAPTNTWKIGSIQPVYWSSCLGHGGGYSYRLCKVPEEGITGITEKCFQDGHLDFVGSTNWVYKGISEAPYDENHWIEMTAKRTKNGTFPVGSEWTKIDVPKYAGCKLPGWGIKDLVQIPEDLEPGNYILSFRWDAQTAAQVWSS